MEEMERLGRDVKEAVRLHRNVFFTSLYEDMIYALDRLIAYEDTGLTPEEIMDARNGKIVIGPYTSIFGVPLDRIHELAEADKKGRVTVLPCNIWDTVWYANLLGADKATPGIVVGVSWKGDCDEKQCWLKVMTGEDGGNVYRTHNLLLGKTVFLSREEAENALRKEHENA